MAFPCTPASYPLKEEEMAKLRVLPIAQYCVVLLMICTAHADHVQKEEGQDLTAHPTVFVANGFPATAPNLISIRRTCTDSDNDSELEPKSLAPGQETHFVFNIYRHEAINFIFHHEEQKQHIVVISWAISRLCDRCYWLVKEDGFYFSTDKKSYQKKYDWA